MSAVDVVVVGAGAAGIFAARELGLAGARVVLLDKGRSLAARRCPRRETGEDCRRCMPCHLLSGWGGAGAYSDGKLSLSPTVGGFLGQFIARPGLEALLGEVDTLYRTHGAPDEVHGVDTGSLTALRERAEAAGLVLVDNPVRHMGTDVCNRVLESLYDEVSRLAEVRFEQGCRGVSVEAGRAVGVRVGDEVIRADAVILAPGRVGAPWIRDVCDELRIPTRPNPVDVGVRVECPAAVLAEVTDALYEAKLYYSPPTFSDEVRTFCMNPRGEVVHEVYDDCLTVNGHSYAEGRSESTNFALLVRTDFTDPFHEPIAYGRSVARLANLLAGGILVQRFEDLAAGRRSTPERMGRARVPPTLRDATPGDLAFALPHRHLQDVIETVYALDAFCPGVAGPDTFLYGAEVKFYSNRVTLDGGLRTPIPGLYGAGDGVGVSRGLVQASASGVWAARSVLADRGRG